MLMCFIQFHKQYVFVLLSLKTVNYFTFSGGLATEGIFNECC